MKGSSMRSTSHRQIFWLLFAAMILMGGVFLFFGAKIDRLIDVSTHTRIEEYATQQRSYISAVLDARYALLTSYSTYFGEELIEKEQEFDKLCRSLLLAGDFDHVLLIDKDGNYRVNTGERGTGSDPIGRQMLLSREQAISRPFRAFYNNNELCVLLSVPLSDAEGYPAGMLCCSYSAQHFGRMLLQQNYRDNAFSLLTDAQGNLLFSSSKDHLFVPDTSTSSERRTVPSEEFFTDAQSKAVRASMTLRENNLYTVNHDDMEYVVVQTPLEQNDWFLFCMVPTISLAADYHFITTLRHVQMGIIITLLLLCAIAILAILLQDYTRLRKENKLLTVRAETDYMTGLLNQATTSSTISEELSQHADGLLLLVDVDNLKGINDTLGHPVGDRAILILSELMQRIFSTAKVIGRIGGDEFMIYLNNPGSRDEVRAQILTLQRDMYHDMLAVVGPNATLSLRCSVGAAYARVGDDYDTLYRRADIALYHVKRHGKDGYAFFSDTKNL